MTPRNRLALSLELNRIIELVCLRSVLTGDPDTERKKHLSYVDISRLIQEYEKKDQNENPVQTG